MINPVRSKKSKISADLPEASWTSNGMKKFFKITSTIIIITLVLFVMPKEAKAAVAFDQISEHATNNEQNPSWTHTPVGTPTAVLVQIQKARANDITSVTYGGTAMTQLGVEQHSTFTNVEFLFYGLATSIPTGAQTVQINADGTEFAQNSRAITFTGTQTTTALAFSSFQSEEAGSGTSGTGTLTVTSATGDLVVDYVNISTDPGTDKVMTPGANQTELLETYNGEDNFATSWEAGGTSVDMTYSWASSANTFLHMYAAINVVQAGVAGVGSTDIGRTLRLFSGFQIKIFNGKLKIY